MSNRTSKPFCKMRSIVRDAHGQGLVEYALILVLIAIVVMFAVKDAGVTTSTVLSNVNSTLTSP